MNNRIPVSIFLFLFSLASHSEVYKWVDEQGNTHYGDKPDSTQSATQLNIAEPENKKVVPDQESRDERRRRLAEVMQEDRVKKQEEKDKARAEREEKNKQCIYARDKLRRLEDSGYLYNLDKEGNRVVLSDEQRRTSIDQYREQIKRHCGN